ncbi:MAG: hypothetical protein WC878_06800 [Candidatus Paceibacterota bacterium]|jgi:hypothetical protein
MFHIITENSKNSFSRLFFVAIFFSLFFIPITDVSAGTGLTIQPIKVSHTINPGEEVSGVISLTNASSDGDEETQITLKVEDFVPFAGQEGINFVGRAPGVTTAMDWITLGRNNEPVFLLKKGESQGIPYTIKAPLDAEPGGHYAVLFFKANRTGEGQQLNVGTQVAILVLITIPGNHLQKGRVLDFAVKKNFYSEGPIDFSMRFENTGTVHFEPKGTIVIKNMIGSTVAEIPVEGSIVLPSGARELPIVWNYAGILIGRYSATVNIMGTEGDTIGTGTVFFYAAPLWYLAEFFASVIIIYFVLRFLKRKVKITINP